MKIPIHTYLAFNSPAACMSVIEDMGYKSQARNEWGLASDLRQLINKFPEETLSRLARIHPDKEIVLYYNEQKVEDKPAAQVTSVPTCPGCNAKNNNQKAGFPGFNIESPTSLFMLFGAFLITAIIISKH